jgi:MerR family mercuric resistance operon transcriptional regulator
MKRGELARAAGCHPETVRFYERIGLMAAPRRSLGGHRVYADAEARNLRFILRARELGFSIAEVRGLLALKDGGNFTCGEMRDLSLNHLATIRGKIADLTRLERTMSKVVAECRGGAVPDCPVVDALAGERTVLPRRQ